MGVIDERVPHQGAHQEVIDERIAAWAAGDVDVEETRIDARIANWASGQPDVADVADAQIAAWVADNVDLTWTPLSFGTDCVNVPSLYTSAWAKDAFGIVHLRGGVKANSERSASDVLATLPVPARPGAGLIFPVYNSGLNYSHAVTINADGTILSAGGILNLCFVTLDGITFPAA